jgi:alkanesulfonate monooxygenase SsuD/methylene tetrahydromethanopterin reductase-like flavin-dependent oxidoreductase (luciferase family)
VLRISVSLPTIGIADDVDVVALARYAELAGLDGVSVPDLVLGDGSTSLECVVTLAAIAGATSHVTLAFGVLVLPLRQPALLAAQLATLQRVSANRVVLGVGAGGFPGTPFWQAAGGPATGRGRHTDEVLAALPELISGLGHVPVPPIFVGGNSDAALRRVVSYGHGWLPSLLTEAELADRLTVLRTLTDSDPTVHVGTHLGIDAAARDTIVADLVRLHGMSREKAATIPITGGPREIAERLAGYGAAGADGVTVALDGDWRRGIDLLAEAQEAIQRE